MTRRILTAEEDELIRKAHRGEIGIREAARTLRCSNEIIYRRWEELRLPRRRPSHSRPPGPVRDCATCMFWKAGTIVLRGNTLGECTHLDRPAAADESCEMHTEGGGA